MLHRVFPGHRAGVRRLFQQPRPPGEGAAVRGAVPGSSRESPVQEPAAVAGSGQPQVREDEKSWALVAVFRCCVFMGRALFVFIFDAPPPVGVAVFFALLKCMV